MKTSINTILFSNFVLYSKGRNSSSSRSEIVKFGKIIDFKMNLNDFNENSQ